MYHWNPTFLFMWGKSEMLIACNCSSNANVALMQARWCFNVGCFLVGVSYSLTDLQTQAHFDLGQMHRLNKLCAGKLMFVFESANGCAEYKEIK